MLIEAVPIDPPDGDLCFAFRLINDSDHSIQWVFVDSVDYEWGEFGNSQTIGARFGPIAPGASVELMRETSTEVRTSITLRVCDASGERRLCAEFGRLYAGRGGKVAMLETLPGDSDR